MVYRKVYTISYIEFDKYRVVQLKFVVVQKMG